MEEFTGLDWVDWVRTVFSDLQTGYFFYTLAYFGFWVWKGKERMERFDKSAAIAICVVSIAFLLFWIGEVVYGWTLSDENRASMVRRMTGKYAFGFWLPPAIYFLVPHLLWIDRLRRTWLSRLLIAFFLFFSFEKFVILMTSMHRDYLPGPWPTDSFGFQSLLFYGILWKLVLFTASASLVYAIRRKRANFAS